MFQTLAYYATVFHRSFTTYTTQRLQQLGLSFGSLFPVIYVGKQDVYKRQTLSISWERAVSMMMPILVLVARMRRQTSNPSIPGSIISSSATLVSGFSCRRSSASSPLSASMTS